jgi:hypothetical protein
VAKAMKEPMPFLKNIWDTICGQIAFNLSSGSKLILSTNTYGKRISKQSRSAANNDGGPQ